MSYRLAYRTDTLLAPDTASAAMVQCLHVPGYRYYDCLVNIKDCSRTMVVGTATVREMLDRLAYFIDIFEQGYEIIKDLDLTKPAEIPVISKITDTPNRINLDNYENSKWYIRFNRKSIDMTAIYDKSQVVIAYHSATIVYGNIEKHREHMLSKLGLILRDLRSFNTYLKDKA